MAAHDDTLIGGFEAIGASLDVYKFDCELRGFKSVDEVDYVPPVVRYLIRGEINGGEPVVVVFQSQHGHNINKY
jgi:hypothetical protein